ncbi:MAG: aryl-sulfate sulfotransferase [Chthoniobacterales bacterium]|nr:aryl-sulfate sulfotransferase [Chthoniobacterales bacterium]
MKKLIPLLFTAVMSIASVAFATQAEDTTISVIAHQPGDTPFISKFDVLTNQASLLKNIQYTIAPRKGSVIRPISATYTAPYLNGRGFLKPKTGQITLPVWGLYAGYNNTVHVKFVFQDGSFKEQTVAVVTAPFEDTCPYDNPVKILPRTKNTDLSYDYMLLTSGCSENSPTILDTDGFRRWVGTTGIGLGRYQATFYDNAVYLADGPRLLRIEMDGQVSVIRDYSDIGVHEIHHNIDAGKNGLILELDTPKYIESVLIEVNPFTGDILQTWNFANIISNAMRAGGDNPRGFVRQVVNNDYSFSSPSDWFHNNAHWYRRADNTLIVSSRENFVIAVDYESKAIKWIFGDKTKEWYVSFPSLRKFALSAVNGPTPVGQHAVSITKDDHFLLFDNGQESQHHIPVGVHRSFSAARKYEFHLDQDQMTQVWSFTNDESVTSPFCSSVYEDGPLNYLVAYAVVGGINPESTARILGLTASGQKVFDYSYPTGPCSVAYRALPIHLEAITFPTFDVHLANMSSRIQVGTGDNVGIAGFIVTGSAAKPVVIRGLGPSLQAGGQPIAGRLMDPVLELYNSAGQLIERNDNYKDSENRDAIAKAGILPTNERESAIAQTLPPGLYTAVLRGVDNTTGIGLVEVYDTDLRNGSTLANLSTRAVAGQGDAALIGGIISQGNTIKRFLFRGIGPQLGENGLENALQDPTLALYDANGVKFEENDDWKTQSNAAEIEATGAAPTHETEAAILMPLPAGVYTGIVRGSNGGTGNASFEVYQLE